MNCKVLVVFIVACMATGYALKCYECLGINDDKCVNIDTDNTKVEVKKCEGRNYPGMYPDDFIPGLATVLDAGTREGTRADKYFCLKSTSTNKDGNSVIRSCIKGDEDLLKKECKDGSEDDVEFTCDLCTDDKCNSSYAIVPSIIVSMAMLFIGKLL